MENKFTPKAQMALNQSIKAAEKFGHTYIGSEHLLLALTEDALSCASLILNKHMISNQTVSMLIKEYSGTGTKSSLLAKHMTPRAKSILENAYSTSIKYGSESIGTEHILLSILQEKESVALKLLKKNKSDIVAIREDIETLLNARKKQNTYTKNDITSPLLRQYGKNLCEMAENEKFDPVIGRDQETERVIRILLRKTKNNPCLVGEAGVGKTAIIEGLAKRITTGDVPDALKNKTIISVDLTSMIAGAKYRGDFEDRIKNIISEVVKNKNIILFIDEIHTIVGAGAAEGAIDASNILKPQLARGELQLIGATTFSEYHKHIEKDSALERRFQPIVVEEPDKAATISMLMALKERYEKHHNVTITSEAIHDCVHLSDRYISDRNFPDKAVDVLDEACVIAKNNTKSNDFSGQFLELNHLAQETPEDFIDAYYREHIDLNNLNDDSKTPVTGEDVRTALSEMCNIPKVMIKRDIDYKDIINRISYILPGLENELNKVITTIRRHDMGFSTQEKPRGIFLFIGESGTGKTELAIQLAKKLFSENNSIIRYDMSEFSEKQSISKLIGSPPGYVGHEDGGGLTEAVRKRPHSLVLFDEIEKADKDVLNILLQIADSGYLSDSSGRRVNFKNTVIVMTSNLGYESNQKIRKTGFIENTDNDTVILSALKKHYTSDFLNRFDDIIHFKKSSKDTLEQIAVKKLDELKSKASENGYEVILDPQLPSFLADKSSSESGGVRSLIRIISDTIERPLIEFIISTSPTPKDIYVSIEEKSVYISENKALKI